MGFHSSPGYQQSLGAHRLLLVMRLMCKRPRSERDVAIVKAEAVAWIHGFLTAHAQPQDSRYAIPDWDVERDMHLTGKTTLILRLVHPTQDSIIMSSLHPPPYSQKATASNSGSRFWPTNRFPALRRLHHWCFTTILLIKSIA